MQKTLKIDLPMYDENLLEISSMENTNNKFIIMKRNLYEMCKSKLDKSGVYFLINNISFGNKSIFIGASENIKEELLMHNQNIKSKNYNWDYNLIVCYLYEEDNPNIRSYVENIIIKQFDNNMTYKSLVSNQMEIKDLNEQDFMLANKQIEEINLYFKLFSLFNIKEENNGSIKDNNKQLKLPKEYEKKRPNLISTSEEKIVGWIYGNDFNIECYKLKEVVMSLFTYIYKHNVNKINEYVKEMENKALFPVYINEEKYKKLESKQAYCYEKIGNENIYIYARMNTNFLMRHCIEILKYVDMSTLDLYFVIKKYNMKG